MNERIKELEKQAVFYNEETEKWELNLEKFAELIVKECADVVENSVWHLPRGYKAKDQAVLVRKNFGVEE